MKIDYSGAYLILIFIIGLILLFTTVCLADSFKMPFDCYTKDVVKVFDEFNVKLDLNGNDRTENSWGFIENKGTEYWIHTYYPTTDRIREELFFILSEYNKVDLIKKEQERKRLMLEYQKENTDG